MRFTTSVSILTLAFATPAVAQVEVLPSPAPNIPAPEPTEDAIVVTAHSLRDLSLMAGSVELGGEALVRASAPQIGEVLAKLPGVSATSFAPGASRPVLRGLGGDRIRVLIDGIGSIDASSVSADHGVTLDTLTIDHVDVLHGPAVLIYGGQAIGGAVNAYDKRIPRKVPEGAATLTAVGTFDSVSSGFSSGGSVDLRLDDRWVAHFDASWHDNGDLRVGGPVLSEPLRQEQVNLAQQLRLIGDSQGAAEAEANAALTGRIPNSFTRGSGFGAGIAFIDEGGNLGISVQRIDSRYGIPTRPGSQEGDVSIDLGQTRVDFRGELKLGGWFDALTLRAAYGDYAHSELEEDGVAGTIFARKGLETRIELIQADNGGWTGRTGVQYVSRSLDVTGQEAIIPANKDTLLGLFTLQALSFGQVEIEAASRLEKVEIVSNPIAYTRNFTLRSGALGLAWHPGQTLKIGANFAHGERAPSAEELLTNGLHPATQSFEIGDPDFATEQSNGGEAFIRYDTPTTRFAVTAFLTDFDRFIAPIPTGGVVDGFPVYRYRQLGARFYGAELQGSQRLVDWDGRRLTLEVGADYVRAELNGNGPAPSIPPLRLMSALEYSAPALSLRGEIEWNAAQNRVGPFENPTQAFTLLNASATWQALGEDGPLSLTLSLDNMLNIIGRRAASVTRDYVPIAGRNLRVQAKLAF